MSNSESRKLTGRLKTMWHGIRLETDPDELTRDELLRRYEQEQILGRVIALSTSKQPLEAVLDEICYLMTEYYDVASSGFVMLNEVLTEGTVIASYARPGYPDAKGEKLPVVGNLATEHMLKYKRVLAIAEAQTDPLMAPLHTTMRRMNIASILLIPIVADSKVVATLGFNAAERRQFDTIACELGERVAIVIGSVLQRIQADEKLEREREFAQRIMGTMGQGLVVVDEYWRIDYCNDAFSRLLQLSATEAQGKSLLSYMPPADRADLEMIYMIQEGDLSQNFDTGFVCSQGQKHYVMLSLVPRQPGLEKSGHIVVVTDLSERKAIEAAQKEARDQAIEASRLKSEFLANMSHEIRTPLNGVIGMTSLLLNTSMNDEQQEYCETIKTSGDLLLALINDILDFSKIEAGKLELEARPFDLRSCVEDALDVIAAPATAKGLELAYWLHESVPPAIVGDVTRLRQIIVNLLSNAVKFTQKGEILVNVKRVPAMAGPAGEITIAFEVVDTGIGIPAERMDRLFLSFSQIDASTTRRFGGTGLGLAISKRLIEMMGGEITVSSVVGKGTTFRFTIRTRGVPGRKKVFRYKDQPVLQGRRVLVVDDNATNRQIVHRQLNQWGMDVVEADSGAHALQLLPEMNNCALILLDMHMPEMDGVELAQQIKSALPSAPPMVMLSSVGDTRPENEAAQLAAYLTKPIKPKLLQSTIVGVLAQEQGQGAGQFAGEDGSEDVRVESLRILLAEDNLVNQKVARRILAKLGYEVDVVATGQAALDAVRRRDYDVILMDVQMPEMDGVEATRIIRAEIAAPSRPYIIALTANAMVGDRERYLRAGMDDYVSKPVRLDTLSAALRKAFPATQGKFSS